MLGLTALGAALLLLAGPGLGKVHARRAGTAIKPTPALTPDSFRCIVVGDSQTTGPNADRIRTQTHRWDAPIMGEQVCVGALSTGFVVNNSNAGIANLVYQNVDPDGGWPGGGADDFFAFFGADWTCLGDITVSGARVGRYRLRFANSDAPWDQPWGIGRALVARIAVRTGPMCVDAVETRAERGGVVSVGARLVHTLSKVPGVQVIEQPIPADFNPSGDDVGVGLYFPSGQVEQAGQVLQVLGVVIERVAPDGRRLRGTLIGYQGRGGWSIQDHLDKISPASRVALINMTDADHVMIMLGHNQEPLGIGGVRTNLDRLVDLWEAAYMWSGRQRPTFVFVVPWAFGGTNASAYILEVEAAMKDRAAKHRRDVVVNYLSRFDYLRPDVYDPAHYQLDGAGVHPGDIPTAVNLSQDLYEMLFENRRE